MEFLQLHTHLVETRQRTRSQVDLYVTLNIPDVRGLTFGILDVVQEFPHYKKSYDEIQTVLADLHS